MLVLLLKACCPRSTRQQFPTVPGPLSNLIPQRSVFTTPGHETYHLHGFVTFLKRFSGIGGLYANPL